METLIQQLKVILATNFALYLKSQNFHWNVEGPDFSQYHSFLGDFYDSVWQQTDNIAEEIRKLNSYAPGSMARFLELADIEEAMTVPNALEMFRQLKEDNDRYIIHLKAGIVAADQVDEPATSNFLQDILGNLHLPLFNYASQHPCMFLMFT